MIIETRKEEYDMGKSRFRSLLFCIVAAVTLGFLQTSFAAETPIKFRFATYFGQEYADFWPAHVKFVDTLKELGKGKIVVDFYPSETLLKANQLLPGLINGSADAVSSPLTYWHGTLPITQGFSLPLQWRDASDHPYKALNPDSPVVKYVNDIASKKNVFMYFAQTEWTDYLWVKDKKVKSPADCKGLKIRASGIIAQEVSKALGAGSVALSSAEIYTALERGTVNAVLGGYTTIVSRGLDEQLKYVPEYPFSNFGPFVIGLRRDWYDKLPNDVRKIFDTAGKAYYEAFHAASQKVKADQIAALKKKIEFIKLTPQETEAFNKTLSPLPIKWLERKEIGDQGKRLLELIKNVQ